MAQLRSVPQIGLMDQTIEDKDLEALLEDRETAKDKLKAPRDRFNTLNKQAVSAIELLELDDGEYRVGRFTVKLAEAESMHIEFERQNKRTVRIRPTKDD